MTSKTEMVERNRLRLIALIPMLFLSSCATSNHDRIYKESFSSIYISQDQKKIVVIGTEFHYIFDTPKDLPPILNSPLRNYLNTVFSRFYVENDEQIEGSLRLTVPFSPEEITQEQKQQAHAVGITQLKLGEYERARFFSSESMQLKGRRFAANPSFAAPGLVNALNRTYSVEIFVRPSRQEVQASLNPSPIQQAANGMLMIAALPLLPFFLVAAVGSCAACR